MAYIYINPVIRDGGGGDDPWAAFLSPDSTASALTRNDPAPIDAPRAAIPSTPKVWGDKEAEAAGLYEPKQVKTLSFRRPDADPWAAFVSGAPQKPPSQGYQEPPASFDERFVEGERRPDMQAALTDRATQMTQGTVTSPAQNMLIGQNNILGAATQGTNPNASAYGGKLISKEAFQSDSGEILYRDPVDGQVKPTDSKTQVAIRDPADNTVKIFERSEDTNEGGVVGASRVLSQGLLAGAPTARAAVAAAPKSGVVKASDIFATSKQPYRNFTEVAKTIPIEGKSIVERLRGALDGVNLTEDMAGAPAKAAIKMLDTDQPLTLDFLQKVKRVADRGLHNGEKDVRDGAKAIASEVRRIISEVPSSAGESFKTANEIHATALAKQDLQRKEAIAGVKAGSAGYGGNAVNSMRQQLRPIVEAAIKDLPTKFKPDEITAMREIVEGTRATNLTREVGQLSPSKGHMAMFMTLGSGGVLGGIGAVSNKLATVLTKNQIQKLNETVAKRSPAYAEAVSKAVQRWESAQAELGSNPTPAQFAKYVVASRALASGLTRDGIQIASGDLLKAIQGPMRSAAEEDQPSVDGRPSE